MEAPPPKRSVECGSGVTSDRPANGGPLSVCGRPVPYRKEREELSSMRVAAIARKAREEEL